MNVFYRCVQFIERCSNNKYNQNRVTQQQKTTNSLVKTDFRTIDLHTWFTCTFPRISDIHFVSELSIFVRFSTETISFSTGGLDYNWLGAKNWISSRSDPVTLPKKKNIHFATINLHFTNGALSRTRNGLVSILMLSKAIVFVEWLILRMVPLLVYSGELHSR